MDATLLVTAPPALQRARVMARPGMTEATFAAILSRQMPDAEKRARATHIIETLSHDSARACVRALIDHIRESRDA
jgi:dephospho-CoA kinase